MDITKTLELILAACGLVGIIWQVFQTFDKLDRQLALHIQATENKNESTTFILNQLNEKIDHKFRRLLAGQKDIQQYLAKEGKFIIREYFDPRDESGQQ